MEAHQNHEHHFTGTGRNRLKIALGIVLSILAVEVAGGIISNSLALIGDAGHMLVDALALTLSLFALLVARRPANLQRTFGYYRVEIMAALANGTILLLVAVYIFYEAYHRFLAPVAINVPIMLIVGVIGLVANLAAFFLLRGASRTSLNIKAAFWHVAGDTLSSVGVIVAAVILYLTGWPFIDSLIAIFIGCIIMWGAIKLVRESVEILMEAVPGHIRIETVIDRMKEVPGVEEVHDIHVWTITSGVYALSTHIVIEDQMVSKSAEIVETINSIMSKEFDISHTTLQLECESCPTGAVCELAQPVDEHQ
jgi:cobalt-zinc-cadmium efflux system protein